MSNLFDEMMGEICEKNQKIADLEAKLAESKKSNEYFADRVEKADKEIKEIYKEYNKLVEEYNNLYKKMLKRRKCKERIRTYKNKQI